VGKWPKHEKKPVPKMKFVRKSTKFIKEDIRRRPNKNPKSVHCVESTIEP
jgi:hypothetical protein